MEFLAGMAVGIILGAVVVTIAAARQRGAAALSAADRLAEHFTKDLSASDVEAIVEGVWTRAYRDPVTGENTTTAALLRDARKDSSLVVR